MANTKSLKDILREQTSGISPLVVNRKKLETDDIVNMEQLTLSSVDLVTMEDEEYAVVVFAEIPDGFYFGGTVLTDIVKTIYKFYGEDGKMSLDVSDDDITLECEVCKSKNKRKYISWKII